MDDLPRRKLAEIVAQYGPSVWEDPRRCRALLMDLCGEHRREIFVLVSAAEEEVATELRDVPAGVPTELLLARLTERLVDNRALDEDAARWAVESWALALGMRLPPRAARSERAAPPAPRSHRIDDRQLAALAPQLAGLTRVDLPILYGDITDDGLAHLAGLSNLAALDLFWCRRITDRGMVHLRGLTGLTSLGLSGTQVTDLGLARLTTLVNLARLDLSWCAGVTDAGLAYLRGLVRLAELDLRGCARVTARGVQSLQRPGRAIRWP